MRFDLFAIYTDSEGKPIPRPDPLPDNPTTEELISWQRSCNTYFDRIASAAAASFADRFRKSLK